MKKLYFGDCLVVLKELYRQYPEGFIDLIYIDPPFNSKRNYNVLFEDLNLEDATAQKQAFADTWSNVTYIDTLNEIQDLDLDIYKFLQVLDNVNISKSAVSYLTTMAIRIYYIHKVLNETGSFYLHCDPTMSHYLKIICDMIFGEKYYRNEIVWCYKERELSKKHWNKKHDIILFYTKSDEYTFNWDQVVEQYSEYTMKKKFKYVDKEGKSYRLRYKDGRNDPKIEDENTYRQYADKGVLARDWWQIPILNQASKERLQYPTQKPEILLEKIVKASSNKGDLVADFFCGCGTTISVAEKLERNWIGADISHLAIKLIVKRLSDPYENSSNRIEFIKSVDVTGFPEDIASAKELARNTANGRFSFQDWIIEVMLGGIVNPKKVGDGGWDGYMTFNLHEQKKSLSLIEVKSGNVTVKNIREFIQVVDKQKADIGIFVCFEEQKTSVMEREAKLQGYFEKEKWGTRYEKIQIITVEDLLNGKYPQMPQSKLQTFKTASKSKINTDEQGELF